MRLSMLRLQNFRAYEDSGELELDAINLFVGQNNAGKSTILKAIHSVQQGHGLDAGDVRVGSRQATLRLDAHSVRILGLEGTYSGSITTDLTTNVLRNSLSLGRSFSNAELGARPFDEFLAREPSHSIIPFYSNRKTSGYTESTNADVALGVYGNLSNLAAKLARLVNPGFPGHRTYSESCTAILGKPIFSVPGINGQQVGQYIGDEILTLRNMGDGIPHILGMLVELSTAKDKVFLIEEPENDLHPQALKALLDLIAEQAQSNQFFITTHSNIVVRHLASRPNAQLFRVANVSGANVPTATVTAVEDDTEARMDVLTELGYTLSDFELWEGWLILEESSAQRIISEFLIPMFAPRLASLCLVSAGGVDKVEPVFQDFMRLVLFAHLQQPYKSRTWVRVDSDKRGNEVVERLRSDYADWPTDRFGTFNATNFEEFFPSAFASRVAKVLKTTDRQSKREEKRKLLIDVVDWLREDRARAEHALEKSAEAVIADLRAIESQL